ncbi:MAG: S8 family serine peptidase [Candidatus Omnitrophica bacterium]|nr:S8 family serine peptidase [Candidatus Omnitrophota bacterium]
MSHFRRLFFAFGKKRLRKVLSASLILIISISNPPDSNCTQSYLISESDEEGIPLKLSRERLLYHTFSDMRDVLAASVVSDPYYGSSGSWGQSFDDLWGLKSLKMSSAWDLATGKGVLVAVVDTGLDISHIDIDDNVFVNQTELNGLPGVDDDGNGYVDDIHGWDFAFMDNDPNDGAGHGTHVSGTIAAEANNEGVVGVAYDAKILPARALDGDGEGSYEDVAAAIRYAADMGAKVINMSIGGPADSILKAAIDYAFNKGCILIAAAGNSGETVSANTMDYPARYSNVISVGAIDPDNQRSYFSSYGAELDIMAPGNDILSLLSTGSYWEFPIELGVGANTGYTVFPGTSMATPHIAGIVALMFEQDPDLSFDDALRRLKFSAVDLGDPGWDKYYGWGRADAFRALSNDWYDSGQVRTWWLAAPDQWGMKRYDYYMTGEIQSEWLAVPDANKVYRYDYFKSGLVQSKWLSSPDSKGAIRYFFYESGRLNGLSLASTDTFGNISYQYYDENMAGVDHGRVLVSETSGGAVTKDLGYSLGTPTSLISDFSGPNFYSMNGRAYSFHSDAAGTLRSKKINLANGDTSYELFTDNKLSSLKYVPSQGKTTWLFWGDNIYDSFDNVAVEYLSHPIVTGNTKVGSSPMDIVLSPDGAYAYTANYSGNSVSVIRTSDNTVIKTVPVGSLPYDVAISPDGQFVYAANYVSNTMSVIRSSDNTVIKTVTVNNLGINSTPLSITPDGAYVYVANGLGNSVSVVRTSDNTITRTVSVGSYPSFIAITPNGSTAYVSNKSAGTVSVIRLSDNTVIKTVTVGTDPRFITVSPDGAYAYALNYSGNSVAVIRTSDNSVIKTVSTGKNPIHMTITSDGAYAYVVNSYGSSISVIRTSDNIVIKTVSVGSTPVNSCLNPAGTYLYVSNSSDDTVSVIRTSDNTVTETIKAGDLPTKLAVTPDGNKLLVLGQTSSDISSIDTATGYKAFTFNPATGDLLSIRASFSYLGMLPDPSWLDLPFPASGDWWKWCFDNGTVPEFPPLSSAYVKDGSGKVLTRTDHNDYLDTEYTYTWDYNVPGQVKIDMKYDHDSDGQKELIRTEIYANAADTDISHTGSWPLVSSETYGLDGNSLSRFDYTYYPGSGRIMTMTSKGAVKNDPLIGSFDPNVKYVKKYYLDESGENGLGRVYRLDAPLANWELSFDGDGDKIDCGRCQDLDLKAVSVSAWVKFSPEAMGTWQPIFVKRDSLGGKTFEIWKNSSDRLYFMANDGTGYAYFTETGFSLTSQAKWYNVIMTFDGAVMKGYINGIMAFSVNYAGIGMDFAANILLGGRDPGSDSLSGALKDVRVYNSALSGADIMNVYNGSTGVGGSVARWALDEGSGNAVSDGVGGNNGTIYGSQWTDAGLSEKSWYYQYTYLNPLDPMDTSLLKREKMSLNGGKLLDTASYFQGTNMRIATLEVYSETTSGEFEGKHVKYHYMNEDTAGQPARVRKAEVIEPLGELLFHGSGNYVNLGSGPSLELPVFSLSLDVNFSADLLDQWQPLFTKRTADGKDLEIWRDDKGRLYFMGSNAAGFVYARELSASLTRSDRWYNIVFTYDGTVLKGYLDGRPVISSNLDLYGLDFGGDIFLGYRASDGSGMSGKMRNVSLFSRGLTGPEAAAVSSGADIPDGLVSRWNIDDGSGTVVMDSYGNNNGIASGALWITTGVKDTSWNYEYEYLSPLDPSNAALAVKTKRYTNTGEEIESAVHYTDLSNRVKTLEVFRESIPGEFSGKRVKYYYRNEDSGNGKGRLDRTDVIMYDHALQFGANGDSVNCAASASTNLSSLTVSQEVNFSESALLSWQPIFVKRTDDSSRSFELWKTDDNRVYLSGTDGAGNYTGFKTGALSFSKDTWYDIAATYDGTSVTIYLNGTAIYSRSIRFDAMDFYADIQIGYRRSSDTSINGMMRDVNLYSRALSASEINSLHNNTDISTGLVSRWELTEGSGLTAYDSAGSNNGVILGAGWAETGISDASYYYEYSYVNENDPKDGTILSRIKRNYNNGAIITGASLRSIASPSVKKRRIHDPGILSELTSMQRAGSKKHKEFTGYSIRIQNTEARIQNKTTGI